MLMLNILQVSKKSGLNLLGNITIRYKLLTSARSLTVGILPVTDGSERVFQNGFMRFDAMSALAAATISSPKVLCCILRSKVFSVGCRSICAHTTSISWLSVAWVLLCCVWYVSAPGWKGRFWGLALRPSYLLSKLYVTSFPVLLEETG
jgi:hypothetical protein